MLHLTKVAFGAQSLEELMGWFATRGAETRHTTRYRPKRAEEMVGGSLFWILKHKLVARTPILRFEDADGGRTNIVLSSRVIAVRPVSKRAHQGWRYLEGADAPRDLDDTAGDDGTMPPDLAGELAAMGLL